MRENVFQEMYLEKILLKCNTIYIVNIWSRSKKLVKVVLRQEHILVLDFVPLQMLTTVFEKESKYNTYI